MRRIDDPYTLKEVLARLSDEPLTPAQARLLLAARGIRARQKIIEEAVWGPPKRKRRASLEESPLTPQERAPLRRWIIEELTKVLGWLTASHPTLQEDGLYWLSTVLREERFPEAEEIWTEIVKYHQKVNRLETAQ